MMASFTMQSCAARFTDPDYRLHFLEQRDASSVSYYKAPLLIIIAIIIIIIIIIIIYCYQVVSCLDRMYR